MRRPEPLRRVLVHAGVLPVLLACVVSSGCNRITLLRPDASRGDFRSTGHRVEIRDRSARPDVQGQLVIAQQKYAAGDLVGAEQATRVALKADPRSANAYALLALVSEQRGNARDAAAHYQRAIELAPQQGAMHNNYGAWLCRNGRAAEALASFERALADPAYASPSTALGNLGACADMAGDQARARTALARALELDASNPVALGTLAEIELRNGDALRARAFSERRLAAAAADAQALRIASQIEEKLGDRLSAESYVRRLRTEFPQEPVKAGDN